MRDIVKTKNVIEINGKKYDAHTGKMLDTPAAKNQPNPAKKSPALSKKSPRSIDGIHGGAAKKKPAAAAAINKPKTAPTTAKKVSAAPPKRTHNPAPHLKTKVQRSKTLHRKGVKTPVFTDIPNKATPTVAPTAASEGRLQRAFQINKSSQIKKFSDFTKTKLARDDTNEKTPTSSKPANTPVENTQPTQKLSQKEQLIANAAAKEINTPKAHEKTRTNRKYKKHISFAGYGAVAAIVLILCGYIAYLNVPAISMKVAANRAGFAATLPSYQPAGYRFNGPIGYGPNLVTINYQSTTDNRAFSLSQRPTTWDTNAVKEAFVEPQTETEPITVSDRGLSIFVYDGKAAWVNAGKLYAIETKGAQLGINQILDLASSM